MPWLIAGLLGYIVVKDDLSDAADFASGESSGFPTGLLTIGLAGYGAYVLWQKIK